MQKEQIHTNKNRKNELRERLSAKPTISVAVKEGLEELIPEQNSRVRRLSEQLIVEEIKELEKRQQETGRKRRTTGHTKETKESQVASLRDIAYQKNLKKDIEANYKNLQREGQPLSPQIQEDLDYETFKMVKQNQKVEVSEIRGKLLQSKTTTSTTITNKGPLLKAVHTSSFTLEQPSK